MAKIQELVRRSSFRGSCLVLLSKTTLLVKKKQNTAANGSERF